MKLRFLGGRYQGRIIDLKPAGFAIGRERDNDLVLDEEGVSRRHCCIKEEGGKWLIEDLQSTNGVRINGERIEAAHELKVGDRVGIHHALLLFTDGSDIVSASTLEPVLGAGAPAVAAAAATDAPAGGAAVAPAAGDAPAPAPAPAVAAAAGTPSPDEDVPVEIPWVRILLLLIMMGVLIWVVVVSFLAPPKDSAAKATGAAPPTQPVKTEPAPKGEFSDEELAKLMSEEEAGGKSSPAASATPRPAPAADPGAPFGKDTVPPQTASAPTPAQPPAATPVVIGMALVNSDPPGATVLLNDRERGVTPLVIKDMEKGRHKLTLRLQGYEDLVRHIHMPEALPAETYTLRQNSGTVRISSNPAGATVWHGTQILGQTPLILTDLSEGQQEFKVSAPGYETAREVIDVSKLRGESRNLTLVSLLGGLEVVTTPPGCRVWVDGVLKGSTVASEPGVAQSRALAVHGMAEGEHAVSVEHPNGGSQRAKVKVVRGETNKVVVQLWILDTKLTLKDGTVKYGMLMERDRTHGDVLLAEAPKTYKRYYNVEIERVESLSSEEAQAIMNQLRGPKKPAAPESRKPRPADTGNPEQAAAREDDAGEAFDEGGQIKVEGPAGELKVSVEEIAEAFKKSTATELSRRFESKKIALSGVASGFGKDGLGGYVSFLGGKVRCMFNQDPYEKARGKLEAAAGEGVPVTIRGTVVGIHANKLIVRDCAVVEAKPAGP